MFIKIHKKYNLLLSNYLRFFIIAVLLLGLFFRFVNLDKKVYWGDETFTSLMISGHTHSELKQDSFQGKVVNIKDLHNKYQKNHSGKKFSDTINALKKDVHPPLYYTLLYFWTHYFGDSVAVTRSLSAVISLLAFPCLYWLCLELFNSSLVGWIAVLLLAVSPFHVLYAQEARMYSLWTVTILLSSAALLRAIRLKTNFSWIIYATTITLGLYTFLFMGFVAIGHGLYVSIIERCRLSKTFFYYLLASFFSIVTFIPWLLVLITNSSSFQSATAWAKQDTALLSLVANWLYNISYIFVDFFFIFTYQPNSFFNWYFGKYIIPIILILIGFSIYFLHRQTSVRVWLFVLTLIIIPALGIILPDLISGGYASIMSRYFTPCYIGIELAVAYLLATQINFFGANVWKQKLWKLVTITLISGGLLSCLISSQSEFWWNKRTTSYDQLQAAYTINQAINPLLVVENASEALSLSHILNPQVKLLIINQPNLLKISGSYSNVFFLQPSKYLQDELEQQKYQIDIAYKGRKQSLWQLNKN
jgi:uncharacterized membrane protein